MTHAISHPIVRIVTTPNDLKTIAGIMEQVVEKAKWGDSLVAYTIPSISGSPEIHFIADQERLSEKLNAKRPHLHPHDG